MDADEKHLGLIGGHPLTIRAVLERAQTRALPLINKSAELAPVQACCGVCRTCVTTNVVTLAIAGVTGAAVYLTRGVRRILFTKSA